MLNLFRQNLYDLKNCFYILFVLCAAIFPVMCLAQTFSSESASAVVASGFSGLAAVLTVAAYILFYIGVMNCFMQELFGSQTVIFLHAVKLRNIVGAKLLLAVCWELCCNLFIICAVQLPVWLFHSPPDGMESIFLFTPGSSSIFSGLANVMILLLCSVVTKGKGEDTSPLFLIFAPFLLLLMFKNGLNPASLLFELNRIGAVSAYLFSAVYMTGWVAACYQITSVSVKKQKLKSIEQKKARR